MKHKLIGIIMLSLTLPLAACDSQPIGYYYFTVDEYNPIVEEYIEPVVYTHEPTEPTVEDATQPTIQEPHPMVAAVSLFLANAMPAPAYDDSFWRFMPYDSHAIVIDLGRGIQGVLASRWIMNTQGTHPRPVIQQQLFWFYDEQLHRTLFTSTQMRINPAGRLVLVDDWGTCNLFSDLYTLLEASDGELVRKKTVNIRQYWALGWMLEDYDDPDYLHIFGTYYTLRTYTDSPPWDMVWADRKDTELTYEDFNEIMATYGLRDLIENAWELPDQSQEIISWW